MISRCFYSQKSCKVNSGLPAHFPFRLLISSLHYMDQLPSFLHWVHQNAFVRQELQVKELNLGGLGVFIPDLLVLDEDPLLMRIPKSNILSCKNASIYNLLVDYSFDKVDISSGIFGLIISVAYELSYGPKSPWYPYFSTWSIDTSFTPPFMYSSKDKSNLKNTDFDYLGLLNSTEFDDFYAECIRFAKIHESLVPIPTIFSKADPLYFSKLFTSITCRAFVVDNFHQLSLVPFADLFNHQSPKLINGEIVNQENVHFVCDGQVCDDCGDQGCDHEDLTDDEMDMDEDEEDGNEGDNEQIESISGDESVQGDLASDENESAGISDEESDAESDEDVQENESEPVEEIAEITMDYISKMEQELEAENESGFDSETETIKGLDSESETVRESDEESTIGEDEDNEDEATKDIESIDDDLANELSESSKCCDIVMVKVPSKEHDYEIFNTYGNSLSNIELLQKYGFISENNPYDSVSLVPYFSNLFTQSTKEKCKQIILRVEWFEEEGFEMINEILQKDHHHSHEENHHHSHEGDNHHGEHHHNKNGEGCCGEEGDAHDDHEEGGCCDEEVPESWEAGVKIDNEGKMSVYANSLENLCRMSHKVFKYKILSVKVKKRMVAVKELLMVPCDESEVVKMCKKRLMGYGKVEKSENSGVIEKIISKEKAILKKYIENSAK